MPGASESRPVIYLALHQIQSHFTPGITSVSPSQWERILTKLPLLSGSCETSIHWTFDVGISFDDGYSELAELLPPLVSQLKVPPIVFVPTDWIGKENRWDYLHKFGASRHLSREAIKELSDCGVLFGSHGTSHRSLTRMPAEQRREELLRSKSTLEEITGREVTRIAYPFGMSNESVIADVHQKGYLEGFTMDLPRLPAGPLRQGRIPVYGCDLVGSIRAKMPGHLAQPLFRFGNAVIRAGGRMSSFVVRKTHD